MSTKVTVVGTAPNLPVALGPDLAAAVDLAKAEKAVSTRLRDRLPAVQSVVRSQGRLRFAGEP